MEYTIGINNNKIEENFAISREMPHFYFINRPKARAFSLVEMSMVLVVLALIIGGIMVGGDMIERSRLRGVPVHAITLMDAIGAFSDKFRSYPGDMANATEFWYRADGGSDVTQNCANPDTDISTSVATATCNGDGDGMIARQGDGEDYEMFRAFQHLVNAEMLQGAYSGIAVSGSKEAHPGQNIMAGDVRGSGYDIMFLDPASLPSKNFTGMKYHHVIHFGARVAGDNYAHGPIISSADAYEIDLKFDDGLPGTGDLVTFTETEHEDCASNDNPTTAEYELQNASGSDCALTFITGF